VSSLRGISLEGLSARATAVADLSPLKGLSLYSLDLQGTKVADLSPLQGMPLELLDITNTPAAKKPLPIWLTPAGGFKGKVIGAQPTPQAPQPTVTPDAGGKDKDVTK